MRARELRGADGECTVAVKESQRWVEGYERVAEQSVNLHGARSVYVADREAGLVPLMLRTQEMVCLRVKARTSSPRA